MIRALMLVLLGAASFVAVYVALGPRQPDAVTPTEPVATSDAAPAETASVNAVPLDGSASFELRGGDTPAPDTQSAAAPTIRDVTPANMTAAPPVHGPLTRISPPAPPADEHPPEAHDVRLFNPIVVSAGTIKADDREIHLAGINAPALDKSCGEGSEAWPCGRMARAALRRFLHGRAIECQVPAGTDAIPDPATCNVAGDDISQWLVATGWAERSGDAYKEAEKAAHDAKLGLWSDSRPGQTEDVATSG